MTPSLGTWEAMVVVAFTPLLVVAVNSLLASAALVGRSRRQSAGDPPEEALVRVLALSVNAQARLHRQVTQLLVCIAWACFILAQGILALPYQRRFVSFGDAGFVLKALPTWLQPGLRLERTLEALLRAPALYCPMLAARPNYGAYNERASERAKACAASWSWCRRSLVAWCAPARPPARLRRRPARGSPRAPQPQPRRAARARSSPPPAPASRSVARLSPWSRR